MLANPDKETKLFEIRGVLISFETQTITSVHVQFFLLFPLDFVSIINISKDLIPLA